MHLRGWGFVGAGFAATFGAIVPGYWPYLGADACIRLWDWPPLMAWIAVIPSQAAVVGMIALLQRAKPLH